MIDLNTAIEEGGYSIYLPALSTFFVRQLVKSMNKPKSYQIQRFGSSFNLGSAGLNFLDQHNSYFHYKWSLYSAGHAHLDLTKGAKDESIVHQRDRKHTTLIGDSSGYQVAKGASHFKNMNWDDFSGVSGDVIRHKILTWLESTADWSMTFDVPAMAADAPYNEKTKLKTFQDTLDYTVINLNYFMKHRTPGATKFLNVLSGSTALNSKTWYDTVIPYSNAREVSSMGYSSDRTLEGYAFAGINKMHMKTALERLLDLSRSGQLENKDWIHFLGIGRLDWACYLTAIQRKLRQHYNPNITISFDAATPFLGAAKGQIYADNIFTSERIGYVQRNTIDERSMKGSTIPLPFQSPIADRMTIGHICQLGHGDLNQMGKIGLGSWDSMSYVLVAAHCVYKHIEAVIEANRLVDFEMCRGLYQRLQLKDWTLDKKNSSANKVSDLIPASLLFFNKFIEELFDPNNTDPYKTLNDNSAFLDSISIGGKHTDTFDTLFADPSTVQFQDIQEDPDDIFDEDL